MKPLRQLTVVPTLPPNLEPLRELALNLWWTWDREALVYFDTLIPNCGKRRITIRLPCSVKFPKNS